MTIQTIDQQIAASTLLAYNRLQKAVDKDELPGYIKKTSTRLRVSGLGVTVAFCLKNKEDLAPIAMELATVLSSFKFNGIKAGDAESLLTKYCNANTSANEIRHIQTYSEQILEWLAKWADTYKDQQGLNHG